MSVSCCVPPRPGKKNFSHIESHSNKCLQNNLINTFCWKSRKPISWNFEMLPDVTAPIIKEFTVRLSTQNSWSSRDPQPHLCCFSSYTHTHTFGSDFLESFPPRCTKYKITQSSLLAKLSLIYLSLEISCKQQKEKNTNHFHFAMKHLQSWTNIPHQIHPTRGIFLPGISMYTCLSVCLFWKAVLLCSLGKPTHNPAISAFQIAGLTGMHHHTRF